MRVAFCDSSAFVKLVVKEPESSALELSHRGYAVLAASAVVTVDVPRAVRCRDPELATFANQLLRSFRIVALDQNVLQRAASIGPAILRSLDAIQLASALRLARLDPVFVAYDTRILQAAAMAGLRTSSPK